MREVRNYVQECLWQPSGGDHLRTQELMAISQLLDEHPEMLQLIWQDLNEMREHKDSTRGAKGLSADQVLRILIIKQMFQLSYRDLAFFIFDSVSLRHFCRIPADAKRPSHTSLSILFKALKPETMEALNRMLTTADETTEESRRLRVDSTVVETNIHHPTDSGLLWDSTRVLTRLLNQAQEALGVPLELTDRSQDAKRLQVQISFTRGKNKRQPAYEELIELVEGLVSDVERLLPSLKDFQGLRHARREAERFAKKLEHHLGLAKQVLSQTRRRVLNGESVPAQEKIVSIFEEHTDIINKGSRGTQYGHKICLSAGESLILDCQILEGNPADVTLASEMIERCAQLHGQLPEQVTFDGGFASLANLKDLKDKEFAGSRILDVVFAKKRGLKVEDMARSHDIYTLLRDFRAGVEGLISYLKRSFGLRRCLWKSLESFKSYVWSSIVAANLLILARRRLTPA